MSQVVALVKQYQAARATWKKAGKPERSQEEMEAIFNDNCATCEFLTVRAGLYRCGLCGCCVTSNRKFMNKLAFRTESCPDGKFYGDVAVNENGEVITGDEAIELNKRRSEIEVATVKKEKEERERIREERRARRAKRIAKRNEKRKSKQIHIQIVGGETGPPSEKAQRIAFLGLRKTLNRDPLKVTRADGSPANLRDLWCGAAAFLVGGGPSINKVDYNRLSERGVVSLGINNVAGHAPVSMFTCADPAKKFHHGIWLDPAMMKFVPTPRLKQYIRVKQGSEFVDAPVRVRDCPNVWGFEKNQALEPEKFLTDPTASWGRNDKGVAALGGPKQLFTFFLGFRILHYLGVRRIYLLGVDFRMEAEEKQKYAFAQDKHAGGCDSNNGAYRNAAHYLKQIAPVLEEAGVSVFNCNPESALEIWPHISFSDAIKDCKGFVPDGPFDLSGWYEKKKNE